MPTKRCTICGVDKAVSRFSPAGKYLQAACKDCRKNQAAAKRSEDPSKHRAATKRWREKNPVAVKNAALGYAYGLTVGQFNDMVRAQNNKCATCNVDGRDAPRGVLCVDHQHATSAIRKLLCLNCNRYIGYVRENPETAERMALFFEEYQKSGSLSDHLLRSEP